MLSADRKLVLVALRQETPAALTHEIEKLRMTRTCTINLLQAIPLLVEKLPMQHIAKYRNALMGTITGLYKAPFNTDNLLMGLAMGFYALSIMIKMHLLKIQAMIVAALADASAGVDVSLYSVVDEAMMRLVDLDQCLISTRVVLDEFLIFFRKPI